MTNDNASSETDLRVTDEFVPVAAKEDRDVDWVDVTGWAVFEGHDIPVSVAKKIAARINLYYACRVALGTTLSQTREVGE